MTFSSKKKYVILCNLQLIFHGNTIILIYHSYYLYNWWQLASENFYGYSMCGLRTICVYISRYPYTESVCVLKDIVMYYVK